LLLYTQQQMSSNEPGIHPGNTSKTPVTFGAKGSRLLPAVALALVGFIGYTLATGKGKASPVPTIQNKEETVSNRSPEGSKKENSGGYGEKKEGESYNAHSERR